MICQVHSTTWPTTMPKWRYEALKTTLSTGPSPRLWRMKQGANIIDSPLSRGSLWARPWRGVLHPSRESNKFPEGHFLIFWSVLIRRSSRMMSALKIESSLSWSMGWGTSNSTITSKNLSPHHYPGSLSSLINISYWNNQIWLLRAKILRG